MKIKLSRCILSVQLGGVSYYIPNKSVMHKSVLYQYILLLVFYFLLFYFFIDSLETLDGLRYRFSQLENYLNNLNMDMICNNIKYKCI